ncbi:regulatory protein RecX [Catenovulum sediminis]|uniref:regulatory protein RecX n=1 Tax=Catenovulum sediminis TaxID=1740262 RepID=UPI00117FC2A8|nr:regulatory protein RecX [Catenovulum sediminis]
MNFFNPKQLPDITDKIHARQYVLNLLSRKEYARSQLEKKLTARACPHEIIKSVLDEFNENNWQSDQRFAEVTLKSKSAAGYGPKYIQQLFYQHQVDCDVNQLADSLEIDWVEIVVQLIQKKYTDPLTKDFKEKQKRMRFLYSRGFSGEYISAALAQIEDMD